ncbi:MAG: LuxR C-terminal-related transcriptional regulator [Pseudomonadota bacterium]
MKSDWIPAAARMVEVLGTPAFPATLAAALRQIAPFEFIVVFGYAATARPVDLYDDFPPDRRRLHVEEYQEGPYLLDPFFLATPERADPGLWRLGELAPDRFYQGEYFKSYYAQTGLAEEIGYLVDVDPQSRIVVSLMRTQRRFSSADLRALKEAWPLVDACCRRHWAGFSAETGGKTPAIDASIERAFRTIGEGMLTPREREVVEFTLKGHSAEAIGRILGISSGTVRIHRRNIYSKLRINSQGELFSAFISEMIGSTACPGEGDRVGDGGS